MSGVPLALPIIFKKKYFERKELLKMTNKKSNVFNFANFYLKFDCGKSLDIRTDYFGALSVLSTPMP